MQKKQNVGSQTYLRLPFQVVQKWRADRGFNEALLTDANKTKRK